MSYLRGGTASKKGGTNIGFLILKLVSWNLVMWGLHHVVISITNMVDADGRTAYHVINYPTQSLLRAALAKNKTLSLSLSPFTLLSTIPPYPVIYEIYSISHRLRNWCALFAPPCSHQSIGIELTKDPFFWHGLCNRQLIKVIQETFWRYLFVLPLAYWVLYTIIQGMRSSKRYISLAPLAQSSVSQIRLQSSKKCPLLLLVLFLPSTVTTIIQGISSSTARVVGSPSDKIQASIDGMWFSGTAGFVHSLPGTITILWIVGLFVISLPTSPCCWLIKRPSII